MFKILFAALEKVLMTKKNQKNIRFSPQQSRGNGGYISNEIQRGSEGMH